MSDYEEYEIPNHDWIEYWDKQIRPEVQKIYIDVSLKLTCVGH